MTFLKFLRIVFISMCFQSASYASELSYVTERGTLKEWSSRDEYNQSLQDFLKQEQRISSYAKIKEDYINNDTAIRRTLWAPLSPVMGGVFGLILSPIFCEKEDIPPMLKLVATGAGLGGIFGLWLYGFFSDPDEPLGTELETFIRAQLRNRVTRELYTSEYLTIKGSFPVQESSTKVEEFINLVLKRGVTPGM